MKLSKTKQKKLKKQNRLKFELALLIAGFSFLDTIYRQTLEDSKKDDSTVNMDELKHTPVIVRDIIKHISPYRKMQVDIVKNINLVIDKIDSFHANTFMLGIQLLNYHQELPNKLINYQVKSLVLELFNGIEEHIEQDVMQKTYDVGLELYNDLIELLDAPIDKIGKSKFRLTNIGTKQ